MSLKEFFKGCNNKYVDDIVSGAASYLEIFGFDNLKEQDKRPVKLETVRELTFVEKLMEIIKGRDVTDHSVYKAAGLDRRLFSKMMSDIDYHPRKDTALALAYALKLDLSEAVDLIERAGYVLSHSNKRDVILEYCFRKGVYDIDDINEVLGRLGEKCM